MIDFLFSVLIAVVVIVASYPLVLEFSRAFVVWAIRTNTTKSTSRSHPGQPSSSPPPPPLQLTRDQLVEQGFTKGLLEALARNKIAFPLSIWVVDNSGSMSLADGHRIVQNKRQNSSRLALESCTRWKEMQQTVQYHAQLAALFQSPTIFRLLNDPGSTVGPQQFSIAEHQNKSSNSYDEKNRINLELAAAQNTIWNAAPMGVTPLAKHLREIRQDIVLLEPQLRADGTKVVVVVATDGTPTDERGYSNASVHAEFVEALRALENLPVWVVVRLCTDNDQVVEYWNELDAQLELSLEVLDDFVSEAKEVFEHNPWLNYGLPVHRMREMGFYSTLFDLLDERKLLKDELCGFFRILFGKDALVGFPDPQVEWTEFCQQLRQLVNAEQATWNPISRRKGPWIDVNRLEREYCSTSFWKKKWLWT